MKTEFGSGFGIAVGSEPDSDSTSFHNGNAAGWARNWVIIAAVFILWVAVAGRRR